MIHSDNGKPLRWAAGAWAHVASLRLSMISPAEPTQPTYKKFSNGRLSDKYLNERWFPAHLHRRRDTMRSDRKER